jgi:hypothetical protein
LDDAAFAVQKAVEAASLRVYAVAEPELGDLLGQDAQTAALLAQLLATLFDARRGGQGKRRIHAGTLTSTVTSRQTAKVG